MDGKLCRNCTLHPQPPSFPLDSSPLFLSPPQTDRPTTTSGQISVGRVEREGGRKGGGGTAEEGTTDRRSAATSFLPPSLSPPSAFWLLDCFGERARRGACVRAACLPSSLPLPLLSLSLSLLPDFFLLLSHFTESLSLSRSFAATAASEARAANSRIQDPRFVRSLSDGCVRFSPSSSHSFRGSSQKLSIYLHCLLPTPTS